MQHAWASHGSRNTDASRRGAGLAKVRGHASLSAPSRLYVRSCCLGPQAPAHSRERRRELAVWRVVGADERAVRRTIVIESATIGGLGALLGVAVGFITAWIWIGINFRYLLGYELEYHLAFGATAWYVVLAMLMTVLAGYGATRQATRQSVLQGIQTQ